MAHRLEPLLRPASVAVVGASDNNDSMGEWSLRNLIKGGYGGQIYAVNPKYKQVQGVRCYAGLSDLPEAPELVIFAVGDLRLEAVLDEAIGMGARAAVIMSTLFVDDDSAPPLRERVQRKIHDAGLVVCGANGMGFYNVRDRVWACGFDSADHAGPGNVALISHSGAGMSGLIDCDERLRINLAVSTGNELDATMDEYLDFALDLPETGAVGLFVETARNPAGLRAALEKAAAKAIPIVAIKVGRTARSARLTVSHSGAMAGDDAAYEALFDHYGVQRVRDMDELAAALILFAELPRIGAGGLATLHDSGGERQLIIDLADEAGVPLAELHAETVASLEHLLDPELPAVNPLDAWSRGGPGATAQIAECMAVLLNDPGAAIGAVVHNRAPYGKVYRSYIEYMRRGREASGKPVVLVAARQGTGHDDIVVASTAAGFPVLDNVPVFLRGVRALFDYRDFLERRAAALTEPPVRPVAARPPLSEGGSLKMLAGQGFPVIPFRAVAGEAAAVEAAAALGYPVALKTAAPGVLHKSDRGGVVLGLDNEVPLRAAYADLAARLGPDVIVARMAAPGAEMLLGMRRDPQFGPIVLLGFGGVYAETLRDVSFLLPPFTAADARRHLDRLKLRPLLEALRGRPALDIDAYCDVAARFSRLVAGLPEDIAEIDINPVIVHKTGCTIVDALVAG